MAGKGGNALHRPPICRKLLQTDTPIQTQPTSRQQPPSSYHTTSWASDPPRPQKRGQNFSETSRCRERAHSPHSSATEAPPPEWPPGGQTNSPIPTLHDHGSNSLTLATVRVSSHPKPYGPINELGLQLPILATEVGVAWKGQRSHRTWEGQCFRTRPHSICYGFEKPLMRFMTTAPLHTATHAHKGHR